MTAGSCERLLLNTASVLQLNSRLSLALVTRLRRYDFTNPSWAERGVADRSGLLLPDCSNEMLQSYRINEFLICIIKFS